jgi:hypothetical protein
VDNKDTKNNQSSMDLQWSAARSIACATFALTCIWQDFKNTSIQTICVSYTRICCLCENCPTDHVKTKNNGQPRQRKRQLEHVFIGIVMLVVVSIRMENPRFHPAHLATTNVSKVWCFSAESAPRCECNITRTTSVQLNIANRVHRPGSE